MFGQIHFLAKIARTDKLEGLYKSLGDCQKPSPGPNVIKLFVHNLQWQDMSHIRKIMHNTDYTFIGNFLK